MIRGVDVAEIAWTWIGTPFAHQHAHKHYACDCIGLVVGIADELKIPEARAWLSDANFRGYTRVPNVPKLRAACGKYLDEIKVGAATLGDILLFAFYGEPMHFAIIAQTEPRRLMVHAYSIQGRVVANGIDARWQRRTVGAYRYRGVA